MGVEIERKFLVDHFKWAHVVHDEGTHYRQGYIMSNELQTVRVRVSDKSCYLNLKSKESEMSRKEYEYEIPLKDGLEILEHFTSNGTEKIRYCLLFAGKIWEIDEFLGDNAGLIVAEIELESETEEFQKPDWITNEVTNDGRYNNSSLAKHPFKDW